MSDKIIATLGEKELTATETWELMNKANTLSLGWCNQMTIKPDWIGFYNGELLRMEVEPLTFYKAISEIEG